MNAEADRCHALDQIDTATLDRVTEEVLSMLGRGRDSDMPYPVLGYTSFRPGGYWRYSPDRIPTIDVQEIDTPTLVRIMHTAPLPEWLAEQLWSKCPRADGDRWRLTHQLTPEDLTRLERPVNRQRVSGIRLPRVGPVRLMEATTLAWTRYSCARCGGVHYDYRERQRRYEARIRLCGRCHGVGYLWVVPLNALRADPPPEIQALTPTEPA